MRKIILCVTITIGVMYGTANGITFDVNLDANQEVPPPTLNGTNPSGSATVNVNTITSDVTVSGSYSGMTSDVGAAHLHGLAGPGEATGVIFGFDVGGGATGTFTGSDVLSSESLAGLLAGQTYLNVHTANNGPGEIRGQVVDPNIEVFNLLLDASQAVPSPILNGSSPSGMATVVVDTSSGEIEVSGNYSGMTSDVMAAHLHGLAAPGETATVIFGFDVTGGIDGTFSGADTLSSENLAGLLAGQTYLNVHTANNGPGEIRAQVPEPASCLLLLFGVASLLASRSWRSPLTPA